MNRIAFDADARLADVRQQARTQRHGMQLAEQAQQAFEAALQKANTTARRPATSPLREPATPANDDVSPPPLTEGVFTMPWPPAEAQSPVEVPATGALLATAAAQLAGSPALTAHAVPAEAAALAPQHLHVEWTDPALPLRALSLWHRPGQALTVQLHARSDAAPARLSELRRHLCARSAHWDVVDAEHSAGGDTDAPLCMPNPLHHRS